MHMEFHEWRFMRLSDDKLFAEASDLGLAPGAPMPRTITLLPTERVYHFARTAREDGEVVGWEYTSRGQPMLAIAND